MPKDDNNYERKPEHVIWAGNIELDLWSRENEYGLFYSGRLKRHYKDRNEEAKVTYYISDRDFNDAISVLSEGIRYTNEKVTNYRMRAAIQPDAVSKEPSQKSQPKTQPKSEAKTSSSPTASSPPSDSKPSDTKSKGK